MSETEQPTTPKSRKERDARYNRYGNHQDLIVMPEEER